MAAPELDALLAADADGPRRLVKDAVVSRRLPDLNRAEGADHKVLSLIKKALKAVDEGDNRTALINARNAVDLAPEHALANQATGLVLERMGKLALAIDFYGLARRFDPTNADVYYNLGLVAWKLDMLDGAERLYRVALQMDPGSAEATINLAGVLRDQERFGDSIELLRAAIYADPENPLYWNSIGTTLLDSNDPEQAITFYTETLRLAPEFARGWHNLGYAQVLCGDAGSSIASSDLALRNPQSAGDRTEMLYSRSQSLLGAGRLAEGWLEYAVRLDDNYASRTIFLVDRPRWDGDVSLAGKRVLLIGEQGVGDEVLFMSVARDMIAEIGPQGQLIVACEGRLAPLFARSFPEARIGTYETKRREGRTVRGAPFIEDWEEIDCWAPMATPLGRYRSDIAAFTDDPAFLTPDPARVAQVRDALALLPEGPKVGLCWKSKLMNSKRSKYFSPFEDWKHVLKTPGIVFVNLQYGEVSEEIERAASDYGAVIHQLPDLDLMADLEGVAALGGALDLALGPLNASTNLTAAVGCPTWFIALNTDWPLLATDRVPFYPASRAFWPKRYGDWASAMREMAGLLSNFAAARQAA